MTPEHERRPGGNRAALNSPQSKFNDNNTRPLEQAQSPRAQTRTEIARSYIRRGWAPIPVPLRKKSPVTPSWQTRRITERDAAEHFDGVGNIGVILGEASGGLVDIDLDCSEAIELAPEHLPTTEAIFGRQGKPRSHWLYRVNGNAPTLQIRDPLTKEMLLELRGDGGHQTIFPGSVHESGELIGWAVQGEPPRLNIASFARP